LAILNGQPSPHQSIPMKNSIIAILLAIPVLAIAQEAPSDDATLIFKSRGDAMHVVFHTSASEQSCEGLTRAAGIYDAELLREKLLPFIAKLQQKANAAVDVLPEGKQTVKAGVPLQVFGQSKWSDKIGKSWSSGQCGPFTQQFTPQAGHTYLALFEFAAGKCVQSVQDITDAAAPTPVEFKPLECSLPRFG
jgi:hypothetical protein